MLHEDPRKIKVIAIGEIKGSAEQKPKAEPKLLDGVNKVDYRRAKP